MPAVASRGASWNDEEAEHLRTCADCRSEWALVREGAAVGRDVTIDADALAERVLHRLRIEPGASRLRRRRWLIGLAAAAIIAIVLIPALLPRGPAAPPWSGPAVPSLAVDIPGLGSLDTDDLGEVLDAFGPSWTETSTTDAPSLDDLDPQELERIERSWEI
jgi:hypothetical protein